MPRYDSGDVDGVLAPVFANGTALAEGLDLAVDDRYVGLGKGLEIVDAGCQTTAPDAPVWDELFLKVGVAELLLHLLGHVSVGVAVDAVVLEEDAELTVEAGFNVLAVLKQP
ncbi:hypothetical protein HYQ46_013056 [Verticillium longisporum]|nr:hypothetical protein HYQ46_013056 [Verticillium longisporum]